MTDLRLALRLCRRHPLLSLAAIASLALGIGANTAIFTVLNGSVLQTAVVSRAESSHPEPDHGAAVVEPGGQAWPDCPYSLRPCA